jgi:hypothetical protein
MCLGLDRLGESTSSIASIFFFFFFFFFGLYSSPCISRTRMRSSSILPSLFVTDMNIIRRREKQRRRSFGSSVCIFNIYMNLASPYQSEVSSKKHGAIPMRFRVQRRYSQLSVYSAHKVLRIPHDHSYKKHST